jgi:hypothetical protein
MAVPLRASCVDWVLLRVAAVGLLKPPIDEGSMVVPT